MARENPTRTPADFLTFFGGLVLLVLFAFIVMTWVRANGPKDEISGRRAQARIATREQLTKKFNDQLESTGWTDKAKGAAHIPVSDAMKRTWNVSDSPSPGSVISWLLTTRPASSTCRSRT